VVENSVPWRIFGLRRDDVTGGWRKLHNEELRDLYSLRSIIKIIKLRRMRCAGYVARIGEKWNKYRLLVAKPEGNRPLKIILGSILEMWDGVIWTGLVWLRIRY
jgi:hypothetical protein